MNHNKITKSNYKPEIDGIRALAVIAVIINHFNKDFLPSGFLGVDIFFVISGYVITSSFEKRKCNNFRDFIIGFYERRIKRLIPALIFFILITSILVCFLNPYPNGHLKTGIFSLFGFSNIYLFLESKDYFGDSIALNPFTHTWSLGVEEQFYLLFPFIIWFTGFARNTHKGGRNLFISLLFLNIFSLITYIYIYPKNQSAAYFLMPTRFWEMASGCLLYLAVRSKKKFIEKFENFPSFFVLGIIIGIMFMPISAAVISTIAMVVFTSVLIISLKEGKVSYSFFTNKKIVFIGLISYSLYLWHWGVLSISRWSYGIYWWTIPFQIALIFLLSIFSYRFIETPLRKRNYFKNSLITIFLNFLVLFLSALSIAVVSKTKLRPILLSQGLKIFPPVFDINTKIPHKDLYCHLPPNIDQSFTDCLSQGNLDSSKNNIFLIGDSHASNHYWSLKSAIEKTNANAKIHTLVEYGLISSLTDNKNCNQKICIENAWTKYLRFFEESLNEGDYIFLSLSRDRFTQGEFKAFPRKPKITELINFKNRLITLSKIKKNIVLIDDIPKLCGNYINYSHEIIRLGRVESCLIEKKISLEDRIGLTNILLDINETKDNVYYVDPHQFLCNEKVCSVTDNKNVLLYSDSSPHFTESSKLYLTDFWIEKLQKLNIIR